MLWERLREAMLRHPEQTVGEGERTFTFAQLVDDAQRRAAGLAGQKYGIYCASELNAARCLLSCLAAGAVAVPLSSRYGETHCRRIVEDMELSRLLTDPSGEPEEQAAADAGEREEPELDGVAVILCTSGTTGRPKGVMLTQEGLWTNLTGIRSYFRIGEEDRMLIARPLYHCAVLVGEWLTALVSGTAVRLVSEAFNPSAIASRLEVERITVCGGTPTLFHHLSRYAARRARENRPLPLRAAAVSGECLTPTVAGEMREAFPDAAFYHVYGLTEAGPRVSALPPEQFDRFSSSAGFPLPGVEAVVAGEDGRPCPAGTEGELLLRTPSAMKGYYRRAEATARAFRGGYLHTGDRARLDEEGRITLLGRIDDMIIRGGINLYPQEIEAALNGWDGIRETAACGTADPVAGQKIRLLAVAPGMTPTQVLAACRARLPAYQWPDEIRMVDELPRNGSGKLMRKGEL